MRSRRSALTACIKIGPVPQLVWIVCVPSHSWFVFCERVDTVISERRVAVSESAVSDSHVMAAKSEAVTIVIGPALRFGKEAKNPAAAAKRGDDTVSMPCVSHTVSCVSVVYGEATAEVYWEAVVAAAA